MSFSRSLPLSGDLMFLMFRHPICVLRGPLSILLKLLTLMYLPLALIDACSSLAPSLPQWSRNKLIRCLSSLMVLILMGSLSLSLTLFNP